MEKEDVWVAVEHVNGNKSYFNVRYIVLNSTVETYKLHFDKISEIFVSSNPNDTFIMAGDYNLADSVTWSTNPINPTNICDAINVNGKIPNALVDLLSFCNLNQFNMIRNVNDRTLDLIISNIRNSHINVSRSCYPLVPIDDHHPAIEVCVNLSPLKFLTEKRLAKTNFYRANYAQLNNDLSNINRFSELKDLHIDDAVNRFYELLEPFIDSIPKTVWFMFHSTNKPMT